MSGGKKARGCDAPEDDRNWFIRENAVALVEARDRKIANLRKQVTKLLWAVRMVRQDNARLRAALGPGVTPAPPAAGGNADNDNAE